MANGLLGDTSSTQDIFDILDPTRKQRKEPQYIPDVIEGTTGSPLWDFIGQATWKFTDELMFGLPGVSDAIDESIKGDAANTFEERLLGGAAGDWEELSDAGKAGAMVGGALGMLPTFGIAGILTKGGIRGAAAIGGVGAKAAVKKSIPELVQAGKKLPVKKGIDVARTLTDDAARTIVDDAFDIASAAGDIAKLEGGISREIYEESLNAGIKANIRQTLELADEELLEGLSRETVKIITRNNPESAEVLMRMLASKVPGFRGSPRAAMLLGAAGYDAAIGLTMGTMRVGIEEAYATTWNVKKDVYGEYEDIGLYDFNAGDFAKRWWETAIHEALVFAPFGIVKHINPKLFGGRSTGASHGKRLMNIINQSTRKVWKPLNKYTNKELRMQLTAMDEIAGGSLNSSAGHKFAKLAGRDGNRQWWVDATTEADTKLMREFLGKIRKDFVLKAPAYWAGEFGADMLRSVPRMAAGVVAMNIAGLKQSFSYHGFTEEALKSAMGESPPEIAANIFTAMFFTRKPHSFNVEASPELFNKIFETGQIENYRKAKISKLRKMVGGLNTFGADQKGLQRIIMNYGHYDVREGKDGESQILIKKTLDSSREFNEIETIFKPYEGKQRTGTTDLRTAFNARISEMITNGDITYEESLPLYEKLYVAEKIVGVYNKNTSAQVNVDSYTPREAFDIVNKVSSVKFNNKFITRNDPDSQIEHWMEGIVNETVRTPVNIQKEHLIQTYEALDIEIETNRKGPMKLPDIRDIDFGDGDVNQTIAYLYETGIKNNWIERGSPLRVELAKFDGDYQAKVRKIYENSTDRMMALIHGEKWSDNHIVDPLVLINEVWANTHNDLLLQTQRYNAYELFTGGTDHNTTSLKARDINNSIRKYLGSKVKPEVTKGEKDVENYGEVDAFIGTLHRVVSSLNPDNVRKERTVMTQEDASSLMELVREATGDLLIDSNNSKNFENYIMNKSMSRLGMNDMTTGIDTKASLWTLMQDANINNQTEGTKPIFPNVDSVKKTLQSALDSKKISQETHDELVHHYTEMSDAISRSGFPAEFVDNAVEQSSGDWQKSITKSLANGLMVMDEMAGDRARRVSSLLDNEVSRLAMLHKQIESGQDMIAPEKREKYDKQLQDLLDSREQTLGLTTMIKTALKDRDPYMLRAVARNEGNVLNVIEALAKDPLESDKSLYLENLLRLRNDITNQAHFQALNESTIPEFIREQLRVHERSIPEKDLQETIMRMTTSQFSNKYRMSIRDIDTIFEIDRSGQKSAKDIRAFAESILGAYYTNPASIQNSTLRGQVNQITSTLKNLSGQVTLTPQNFINFVVDPLRLRMQAQSESIAAGLRPSSVEIDTDLYQITSSYFSKVPVKTLKVDLSSNTLIQDYKMMGETANRGLTGILHALDPDQNHIYLAEIQGIDVKGNIIRNINGFDLNNINSALTSGNFKINNPSGRSEFYRHDDPSRMMDVNRNLPVQAERFKLIPINWNTSLVVRMDRYTGSIHQQIQRQFRAADPVSNDPGGELFRKLEALYDGDIAQQTPEGAAIRNILNAIRRADDDVDVIEAIKLTRMILNMPLAIPRVIDNGVVHLDHSYIKNRHKRDPLTETKNGYIPTDANREKTALLYRNANSELFHNVYNRIRPWLERDPNTGEFRKLKVLSIDDEGSLVDSNGNTLDNPFDSLARARVELDRRSNLNANDPDYIDQNTFKKNVRDIENARKSMLDGEMFLAADPYLATLSMVGLHPDMVRVDMNNDVIGFRSGALKPTITFTDINFDRGSSDYGRVQEWFGKTAFKHNPFMDNLMNLYEVDAITFKSANKINSLKLRANEDIVDQFTTINPNSAQVQDRSAYTMNWNEFLGDKANFIGERRVVEIPFESMSLRGVSREHDPLVGSNTGVHMNHDNGVADWIGIESKIGRYQDGLASMYTSVYYRTALAQRILGSRAESGDPSIVNSAISSVLLRDGIIIEPWALKRLDNNMLGYYMNNGNIAGGIVPDGSLDVMTADMGNLAITIRSDIGTRPTVQYFGEFLPSYYAAQKNFKFPGAELNGVHNTLIQRIRYYSEAGMDRSADGFMANIDGKSFLQVEGRFIDKNGFLRDLDTFETIDLPEPARSRNKRTFIQAKSKENAGLKMIKDRSGDFVTLADAALWLEPEGLSIGMLSSRQPRNMMGDIVINKMAIVEGIDGVRRAHVDEAAGNVSRMNYVDAIKPQDADFDFDKSFNFVAAPGLFWRETNRLAGHVTTETINNVLDRMFDPNINEGSISKTIVDLLGADFSNDQVMYEVNSARGRFVKMHQTVTYLANMFRQYPHVLTFENKYIEGGGKFLQVHLNTSGRYSTAVDNISKMVSRFIDVNKRLPSEQSVRDIQRIQNKILFGYTDGRGQFQDGIFEIRYETTREPGEVKVQTRQQDLNDPRYHHVRDAINKRYILPINKYLKYNRGLEVDEGGMESKATIENYAKAYENLLKVSLDPTNDWGIDPRIDMESGIKAAADYFAVSKNPYDIAMRGLHDLYSKSTTLKEQGSYGKGRSVEQDIIDYVEGGYEGFVGESPEAVHNRVFNKALRNYVQDEARMLRLNDLAKQEKSLILQIEKEKQFQKNNEETELIRGLQLKLDRVQELKTSMEESLTYYFKNDPADPPVVLFNEGYEKGTYIAQVKPIVVIDKAGNIKEVILKGRSNFKTIYKSDKLVQNGKRFQVTDGEEQKGLRILHEAFSGLPMFEMEDGSWARLSSYEARNHVEKAYRGIWANIIKAKELLDKDRDVQKGGKRQSITRYVIERERVLYDSLFHDRRISEDPVMQKALILRMLIPEVSDKIISVRSVNEGSNKQAVYDYMYRENSLNEPIISLLAKISSGEHKGSREFATEVLDDINILKNAAFITTENPNIDINLLITRMYTEPASLDGFMTTEKYLSRDVFDQQRSQDQIARDAARVMIDYASGKGIIDPVILYKASKEMSKRNIPIREQWGRVEHLSNEDGSVREFGIRNVLISERDALKRKDLGERGGVQESTVNRIKSIVDCYRQQK
tara:strand:+ start:2397 stop:11456 length:9060 start_codon:yes stop_codon:yes gene_type:complete